MAIGLSECTQLYVSVNTTGHRKLNVKNHFVVWPCIVIGLSECTQLYVSVKKTEYREPLYSVRLNTVLNDCNYILS